MATFDVASIDAETAENAIAVAAAKAKLLGDAMSISVSKKELMSRRSGQGGPCPDRVPQP